MVLYENFNTTNQTIPIFLGHESFVGPIEKPACGNVEGLPYKDRCNFVKFSGLCDSHKQFLNYIYLQYCIFNPTSSEFRQIISYILNLIICMYYFLILAVAADQFFCPALSTLGKLLKLNENIAGLTLLAIGNSSPDFLSCITTLHHENPMLFSQIMGGSLFVTALIGGIIICIKPFKLNSMVFLRDSLFLMISVLIFEIFLQPDYVITIRECIFVPLIYVIYIGVVFMDQHYAKMSEGCKNIFMDLINNLRVFKIEEWKKSGNFGKFLIIANMPIIFILKLFIPIVDQDRSKNGWCHLLNSIQLSILPTVLYLLILHPQHIVKVNVLWFLFPILVGLSSMVFLLTTTKQAPKYHKLFIIYSIIGSVYVIWTIAHEILNIIALIAIVFRLSPAFIGCTLLSWGNCVGDLMADIALAKRGHQEMGYSATFGSPMFNILITLSIDLIYKSYKSEKNAYKIPVGSLSANCSEFLIVGLSLIIIAVTLTNFTARRSLGIFLIIFYIIFIFGAISGHFEIIHAYGTDHNIDYRFQDGETIVSFF